MTTTLRTQMIRTSLAAALAVMLSLASGCGPSAGPAPSGAKVDGAATSGKTNSVIRGQGTNIALIETNSVFDDKMKNARDPFFPASVRQDPKPAAKAATAAVAPKAPVELALVLNGILSKGSQRIALINGSTIEAGEEVMVRTTNGQARVKCLEIGPQSVTVTVNGKAEPRKLFLKK
jgi:hypothetical protein